MSGIYSAPVAGTVPTLTPGSIAFANASGVLAQDSGFTYDSVNHASRATNVIVNTADYTMGYLGIGFADETKSTGALIVHGSPTSIYARPGYTGIYSFLDYEATAITSDGTAGGVNQTSPVTVGLVGVQSRITYGASAAAFGSMIGVHSNINVVQSGNNGSEFAAFFAHITYDPAFAANAGRVWGTDWTFEGANGVRPNALGGIHSVVNNFFNGSPDGLGTITQPATHSGTLSASGTFYDPETTGTTDSPSGAIWALTGQHKSQAITTYPVDVGIGIMGTSGPNVAQFLTNTGYGFTVGMQIGGSGSNWASVGSRFKYGMWIGDYDGYGILLSRQYSGAAASTPAIAVKSGAGPVIIGATAQAQGGALEVTGLTYVSSAIGVAAAPLTTQGVTVGVLTPAAGTVRGFVCNTTLQPGSAGSNAEWLYVGGSIGTNRGIANGAYGLRVTAITASGSNSVSGSSYGISVVQPTASATATNNYAAQFLGTSGEEADIQFAEELLTLSTVGTTTDTTANLLPAGAQILAVTARVTTTITTATNWSVGDATTAARFVSAQSTLTAGTTAVGLNHLNGAAAGAAAAQLAAAKVRVTTTGTPGAGVIRIAVAYILYKAPTS